MRGPGNGCDVSGWCLPKFNSHTLPNTNQTHHNRFQGPTKCFHFSGIFPNFKANVSTCFPVIFQLPRNFLAGYSCPTRSTITSSRPRIMTSQLPWRQLGDNFPYLSYFKIGPFLGSPRALGLLGRPNLPKFNSHTLPNTNQTHHNRF